MQRQVRFQRNVYLEQLLKEINESFHNIELSILKKYSYPLKPVVFILGSPRSGTTLLSQFLADTEHFGYPSNFLSRFYGAPYWGIKIQQLISDEKYNYNDELTDFLPEKSFQSYLGKTKGFLSPNEFWYFWRRFFSFNDESNFLDKEQLKNVDSLKLCSELAAMEDAFDAPLLFKGMMMNWIISYLYHVLKKNVIFIYIKRDIKYNTQSLLKARKDFWGTEDEWYSFKPPEYSDLKSLEPVKQVVGQIFYTNRAIEDQINTLPIENSIRIRYEDFCRNPNELIEMISLKFKKMGHYLTIHNRQKSFRSFENTNSIKVSPNRWQEISDAVSFFS